MVQAESYPYIINRSRRILVDGSPASQMAKELTQMGVAGVDELNGPDILRFGSNERMLSEINGALEHARSVTPENGVTPLVYGPDLVTLSRLIRASKTQRNRILDASINAERAALYEKIALSADRLQK